MTDNDVEDVILAVKKVLAAYQKICLLPASEARRQRMTRVPQESRVVNPPLALPSVFLHNKKSMSEG